MVKDSQEPEWGAHNCPAKKDFIQTQELQLKQKFQVDDEMSQKLKNERGQTGSGDEGMGRRSEVKQKGAGRGEDGKKNLAIDEKYEAKKISGFFSWWTWEEYIQVGHDLWPPAISIWRASSLLCYLYPSSFDPSSIYPSIYYLSFIYI